MLKNFPFVVIFGRLKFEEVQVFMNFTAHIDTLYTENCDMTLPFGHVIKIFYSSGKEEIKSNGNLCDMDNNVFKSMDSSEKESSVQKYFIGLTDSMTETAKDSKSFKND